LSGIPDKLIRKGLGDVNGGDAVIDSREVLVVVK
jgi:hypothetical protein